MISRFIVLCLLITSTSCAPSPQYAWQDTRVPAREDATSDLDACRDYASRQYRAGMPAGEEYLKAQPNEDSLFENDSRGEWRPDRSPQKKVNIFALPQHDVPVDYTGYPGELDYYPNYLDDILEKCMRDRGWEYSEVTKNQQ